jgi:VanZ family protein
LSDLATEAPARLHREDAWKPWLAAGLWIGLIAFESTNWLSSEHTGSFLYFWLARLFGPINPTAFEPFHHLLRKAGHVFGFAMLSFLLFRAWRATLPTDLARWSLRWASIAWLMTVLVASLDEWHQSYLLSRTGTIRDVFLDSAAALVLQITLWLFLRNRSFHVSREQE